MTYLLLCDEGGVEIGGFFGDYYVSHLLDGLQGLKHDLDLVDVLLRYVASPGQLAVMAQAASAVAMPKATDLVCDSCEGLIYGR